MLRKARAIRPLVDDAELSLHRDVLLRAIEHVGGDHEAIAVLHEARIPAEFGLRILEHRDAGARKADQQRRRIALADDRGAFACAAARRFAALDQQRLRTSFLQVIGGRCATDARTNNDRVVAHRLPFGSTP
jgi:hypothetical protein